MELNEPVFGAPGELIGTMEEVEGEEMVVVEVKATLSLGLTNLSLGWTNLSLGWTNLSLGWINSNLPTGVAISSSNFGDFFSFLFPGKLNQYADGKKIVPILCLAFCTLPYLPYPTLRLPCHLIAAGPLALAYTKYWGHTRQ